MKVRGTVKGKGIAVDAPLNLPEGQQVEVEISPAAPAIEGTATVRTYPMPPELEARIATEPQFENLRRADEIREKLAKRWGGPLNLATQFIREDRER